MPKSKTKRKTKSAERRMSAVLIVHMTTADKERLVRVAQALDATYSETIRTLIFREEERLTEAMWRGSHE